MPGVGVDVGAAEHVGGDGGEEPLGVLLAVEHARAFTAVGIVVAGLPAAALAVAVGADASPVDGLLPEVLDVCHAGFPFVTAAHRHEAVCAAIEGLPEVSRRAGEAIGLAAGNRTHRVVGARDDHCRT